MDDDTKKTYGNPRPIMTKFEKTKVLGLRLEQLQRGAPPMVDLKDVDTSNLRNIALKELAEKKLPFAILRSSPNGLQKELVRIRDMDVLD